MDHSPLLPPQYGTRYVLQNDVRFNFPYGNIPARDLLEFVSWDQKKPLVLVLGCGDIRSILYTIWANLGKSFENSFETIQFTIHDESAAMLARDVLFLYLCIKLPKDELNRQKWLCAFWSIWFCYELLPEHEAVLIEALNALVEFSENWDSPNNPFGSLIKFFDPKTLTDMKPFWSMWRYERVIASVKTMRSTRQKEMDKLPRKTLCEAALGVFDLTDMMGANLNKDIIDQMRNDYKCYIKTGTTFAEELTKQPIGRTKVNPTFFEKPGILKTYFVQCPYRCFQQVHVTTVKKMVKADMHVSDWDKKQSNISDEAFEKQPLLANSFQQFTNWVCASADVLQSPIKKVTFNLVRMDPIPFSYLCRIKFHIVYAFNLIDFLAPPSLVFAGIKLLHDGARFVCGSVISHDVAQTIHKFIHECFGFPSKFLPIICGIRCINHEGDDYASMISSEHICLGTADTDPRQCSMREKLIVWEKCTMSPSLIIRSLLDCPELCIALASCLKVCCSPLTSNVIGKTVLNNLCTDTACQILVDFAAKLNPDIVSSPEFWEPLCSELKRYKAMDAYFMALQVHTLLNGLHIHLSVDKSTCPTCLNIPFCKYIGLFRVNVPLKQVSDRHPLFSIFVTQEKLRMPSGSSNDSTAFLIAFGQSLYKHSAHHIDCVGNVVGNDLQVSCLVPLDFVEKDLSFSLNEFTRRQNDKGEVYTWPNILITHGKIKDYVVRSPYVPKSHLSSHFVNPACSLGRVSKHVGNGDRFETTICLAENKPELLISKLDVVSVSSTQVRTICSGYSYVIKYPYPVNFKNLILQRSKKSKTIVIRAQRRPHYYEEEGQLFHVNPEDHFTFPPVKMDISNKELFMRMQCMSKETMFKSTTAKVCQLTLTVEQTVRQLLMSDDKVFILVSMENDELWAIVEVLNRIVDVTRKVPALHIGYFFLDDVPSNVREVIQRALYVGALQHKVKLVKIEFLREPFKYLKKVFCRYSNFTRQSTLLAGTFVPAFEYRGLINQAVVYPFYQDPGRAVIDLQCGMCKAALQVESLEKCPCEQIAYCNSVCRDKHQEEHSKNCKHSSSKPSATEKPKDTPKDTPKNPNPFQGSGGKYNCANCHKRITSLMACANCLKTWYCGRKCQKADWSRHKHDCAVAVAAMNGGLKCHNCQKIIRGERTKCTGCESVSYCSIPCQTIHWTKHKNDCNGSAKFVIHVGTQAQQKVRTAVKKPSKRRTTKAKKPSKPSKKYVEEESDSSPETPEDVPMSKLQKKVFKTDTDMPDVNLIQTGVPETETPETNVPEDKMPKANVPKADVPEMPVPVTDFPEGAEPEIEADLPDTSATNVEDDVVSKQKKKLKSKTTANIRCAYCGNRPPSKPQRCARCHKVFYCGQECQKADWKDHKAICKLSD